MASILAGRLEEEGIPVFLKKDEAAGSIYGLTVGPLANIRLFVPPSKIEQARQLLEEIERGRPLLCIFPRNPGSGCKCLKD